MKLRKCRQLPTAPLTGVWYRAVGAQHFKTALSTIQTAHTPSRFSPASVATPTFEILYLAQSHDVALREVEALLGSAAIPNPAHTFLLLNVQVVLQAVADLTTSIAHQSLDLTAQELTGDWRGYADRNSITPLQYPSGAAPTQELGNALFGVAGLEGFITYSAKKPTIFTFGRIPPKIGTLEVISSLTIQRLARRKRFLDDNIRK